MTTTPVPVPVLPPGQADLGARFTAPARLAFRSRRGSRAAVTRVAIGLLAVGLCGHLRGAAVGAGQSDPYETAMEKAVSCYSDGDYEAAEELLESLSGRQSDSKEVFVWLGRTRLKLGNHAAAREAFKRYSELAPADPEGPLGVARTYRAEGNRELAQLWYQRAVDRDPTNPALKAELAAMRQEKADTATSPEAAAPETAPTPGKADDTGFWRQGLAGLCGARGSAGARILAVIIFVFIAIAGAVQGGAAAGKLYGDAAPAAVFLGAPVGMGLLYVLYWGWPSGWQWAWAIGSIVAYAIVSVGSAAALNE